MPRKSNKALETKKDAFQEKDWRREEARGLFVLGIIAILIILRASPSLNQIARVLIETLLVFWATYAILIVIGLSDDVFGERISKTSRMVGVYALGCALGYCISFGLLYFASQVAGQYAFTTAMSQCHGFGPISNETFVNLLVGLFMCGFGASIVAALEAAEVFLYGLFPALLIPPFLIGRRMSRKYGRIVWLGFVFMVLLGFLSIVLFAS